MSDKKNYSTPRTTAFAAIGQLLAVVLSWTMNKSFLWAFLHMLFGWWYVIYFYFEYGNLSAISDFIHAMYK